jgi:hypothetical protein
MPLQECTKDLNGRNANQLWCVCTAGRPLHTQRVSRITVKALVTSSVIQSICLVGKGRLKERCGLELRTNVFSFKKSAKTSAD